eukprot:TRINITY_DN7050_c0_g1_i1.p1 TRINITY_DN7050_c0_g1~~TRINITY_DN7050_c0_g1_i1.p1  ORF type:complete len:254 (-),score=104.35 TRINITY_DN7050_c0_g1_i1:373-1050(-)
MDTYTDFHRLLVQYLLSHKAASEDALVQESGLTSAAHLAPALGLINQKIEPLGLKVDRVKDEEGMVWYGVANTAADPFCSHASALDPPEVEYFKRLLDSIVTDGSVLYQFAKNMTSDNMTRERKEAVLKKLVDLKWLELDRSQKAHALRLGVRSLLELQSFLEDKYGDDLVDCIICQELVLKGERCPNFPCEGQLHTHCRKLHFARKAPDEQVCPLCTKLWQAND